MKRHYFLKGLALNFGNYVGYTDYENALFEITEEQYKKSLEHYNKHTPAIDGVGE